MARVKRSTIQHQREEKSEPAKMIAKSANLSLKIIVSSGTHDRDRTYEEYIRDITAALKAIGVDYVTPAGGYYIVDGKVCLPEDYDSETQNRKPGTHPPLWAMTDADREQAKILERIEQQKSYPALSRQPPNLRTSAETPKTSRVSTGATRSAIGRRSAYDWDSRPKSTKDLVSVAPVVDEDVPDLEWDVSDVDDVETVDKVTQAATVKLRKTAKRVTRKR